MRRKHFWFGFGFPPLGAFYFGPGGWRRFHSWGFPRRGEYLEMLKAYREELLEYKKDLEKELSEVEEEIRTLEQG